MYFKAFRFQLLKRFLTTNYTNYHKLIGENLYNLWRKLYDPNLQTLSFLNQNYDFKSKRLILKKNAIGAIKVYVLYLIYELHPTD